MTTEDKLKELILSRYKSIREFIITIDMPYTTIDSMFKRGIGNSSVTNVIKICKALGISTDALADGEIKHINRVDYLVNDKITIESIVSDTKDRLTRYQDVTLNGDPISKAGIESIIDAIDVGVEIAKKKK